MNVALHKGLFSAFLLFVFALFAQNATAQGIEDLQIGVMDIAPTYDEQTVDLSGVRLCDSRDPASWRDAQTIEGVDIEEDLSCSPDRPSLVAVATKGTNNVSIGLLNETGLSPDAVEKGEDKDGDGDPDVIRIHLEIVGLNEGRLPIATYEIAPGIFPAFWAFAPKTTGMVTEGMTAAPLIRMPSPTIRVEQDDEVYLTLENTHYLPHTIHLHGVDHPFVNDEGEGNDGVPQTSEVPIMPGESRTYKINARTAGSMAYHCHVQPDVHILMGLSGMLVVEENRPNNTLQTLNIGAGKVRHRSVASKASYAGEFDLHYQDIDKELSDMIQSTDDPREISKLTNSDYDITERTADYFLLNGKSFPYTIRDSQIIVDPNEKYRIRIFNIGAESIALHTHGHKMLVKALDGIDLPRGTEYYRDVLDVHPAQRADVILNTTDDGLNSYGDGAWLFHSHVESHITTDGISPGGNISMITYRSYMGDRGIPNTLGVDLRPLFTPEYYERNIQVWGTYDTRNLLKYVPFVSDKSSPLASVLIGFFGVLLGFIVSKKFLRKKNTVTQDNTGFISFWIIPLVSLLLLLSLSAGVLFAQEPSNAQMEGISGIHIMPNGDVMLGTGVVLPDATIGVDGMIELGSGEMVKPVMDLRSGGSMESMEMTGVEKAPPLAPAPVQKEESKANPSNLQMEGIEGIHIMPNGDVMLSTGEIVQDATILPDGLIELGSGETISPMMDLRDRNVMGGMEMTGKSLDGVSSTESPGIDGVHVMPNGRVMTGTGLWLDDAVPLTGGQIRLGSGEIVTGMDMRVGGFIRRTGNTMVVNENLDRLPLGCDSIAGEQSITIIAGTEIAQNFPGTMFTYDHRSLDVKPCTLLTVTFKNKDSIRHQFMVHDLPPETYAMGMFNIEVTGPGEETGTFITPPRKETLFVHCGVPEHEAKGMMTQIKVGGGSGDLPNIPGLTRDADSSTKRNTLLWGLVGILMGVAGYFFWNIWQNRNFRTL